MALSFVSSFEIGISKEETKLNDCYITNPDQFVSEIYLNPWHERNTFGDNINVDKHYAAQATVARAILFSLRKHGSEGEFYEAVAVHEKHQAKSRIYKRSSEGKWFKAVFQWLQLHLIKVFGRVNSQAKSHRPNN